MEMTPRQRLMCALRGDAVDRPPVVIPGGMMAGCLYAILGRMTLSYPALHIDAVAMAEYAVLLQRTCELDNYGVPFCMTVEAEDFGAVIDLGSPLKEPRVIRYPASTLDEVIAMDPVPCLRHQVTLDAISRLAGGDVPVIGNLIGPTSLLTSLVEPTAVYRTMAKDKVKVAGAFEHITWHLVRFVKKQIAAGADVIVLADPGASGEIIGGELFRKLVVPSLNAIIRTIKDCGKPAVLHICGNILPLVEELAAIPWDALSVDSIVSLRKLKDHFPKRPLMGNVSTHMMAVSNEDKVYRASIRAVEISAILAPACGLPTTTLPENIRGMVRAAGDAARRLPKRYATDV